MHREEDILQFAWKNSLFSQKSFHTSNNIPIEIIDLGFKNNDSGPDFFNAKIKIDNTIWIGNVEMHICSSDWNKHNHDKDDAYNNVILHVVEKIDCEVFNKKGETIPQFKIEIPSFLRNKINLLVRSPISIPCGNYIKSFDSFFINQWIYSLAIERLERKYQDISILLQRFSNSWDDVFYTILCRNFGFGLNSDAFQQLSFSLPYKLLFKHADNLIQIEALFFGQAGFLEEDIDDEYFIALKKEYQFLKRKNNLITLNKALFKTMRARPASFPHLRIAQLSFLLHKSKRLFSSILEKDNFKDIRMFFITNASDYWKTHYNFGVSTINRHTNLGDSSMDNIIVNTVSPILFSYGKKMSSEKYCARGIDFLESIKSEKNKIVTEFCSLGIKSNSSLFSQGLIQLKKEYCDRKKCMFCRIGISVFTKINLQ